PPEKVERVRARAQERLAAHRKRLRGSDLVKRLNLYHSRSDYEQSYQEIIAELRPASAMQWLMARELAILAWVLTRMQRPDEQQDETNVAFVEPREHRTHLYAMLRLKREYERQKRRDAVERGTIQRGKIQRGGAEGIERGDAECAEKKKRDR